MCKLKEHGKRCPVTPQRKESESYRQKVKYQAKKEGITSKEWLSTEQGNKFAQSNDPRIVNPNWHQEHQDNLARMKSMHPQITMSNNFLASPADLSIIKANFPTKDTVRGREELAVLEMPKYLEAVSTKSKKLTQDEIDSVNIYSSSQYKRINTLLREIDPNMPLDEYHNKFYPKHSEEDARKIDAKRRKVIEGLDSALAERREESEVTYRCITANHTVKKSLEEYTPNSIVSFEGYSSTSHSPSIAVGFSDLMPNFDDDGGVIIDKETNTLDYSPSEYAESNHNIMFEVQSNAGQPIAMHSQIDTEREILIPRGMHFKVVDSYLVTKNSPYRIDQTGTKMHDVEGAVGEIKSSLVVVQLVECDKDGNIVSPNAKDPYVPPPLPTIQNS